MKTVESKIRKIAKRFEGEEITYIFHNWTRVNIDIDFKKLPAIVYSLPASGTLDIDKGFIKDYPNAMLSFIDNTDFDFESQENDCIIENMKFLAMRFFKALNDSNMFEPVGGELRYRVLYDKLDANVTGISFEITLRERVGICEKELITSCR